MKINGSPAYVKIVKGLIDHQKKSYEGTLKPNNKLFKEEKSIEPSPEIQQMRRLLEDKKKALEKLTTDQTAKKIARGEMITDEEREKLRATDPEKLRKADEANERRYKVHQRLANAKTKEEARAIITSEKMMGYMIYDKGDEHYGQLLIEAVGKAEADYYGNKQFKPVTLRDTDDMKRERLFDLHF